MISPSFLAFLATVSRVADTPSTTGPEAQVAAVDQAWTDAEVASDRATLDRILDDGFVATFDTDDLMNKARFVKSVTDDWKDPTKSERLSDRVVHVDGDTAIVVETDTIGGTTKAGKPYSFDGRLTAVFVLRNGQWKGLALHFVTKTASKKP